MKIKKQKQSISKKILPAALIVALLVVGTGTYLYAFKGSLFGWSPFVNQKKTSKIDYNPPTEEQKKTGQEIKSQSVASDSSKPGTVSNDNPPTPTTQSNGKSTVDVTITAANQNGVTFQLRTLIGAVTSSGTCTLIMSKGATTVTKTASVQALARGSTCQGFDIPMSELSSGNWQIELHFENDSLQGDIKQSKTI